MFSYANSKVLCKDNVKLDFLHKTTVPMLYVKKDNGGVHTARKTDIT